MEWWSKIRTRGLLTIAASPRNSQAGDGSSIVFPLSSEGKRPEWPTEWISNWKKMPWEKLEMVRKKENKTITHQRFRKLQAWDGSVGPDSLCWQMDGSRRGKLNHTLIGKDAKKKIEDGCCVRSRDFCPSHGLCGVVRIAGVWQDAAAPSSTSIAWWWHGAEMWVGGYFGGCDGAEVNCQLCWRCFDDNGELTAEIE